MGLIKKIKNRPRPIRDLRTLYAVRKRKSKPAAEVAQANKTSARKERFEVQVTSNPKDVDLLLSFNWLTNYFANTNEDTTTNDESYAGNHSTNTENDIEWSWLGSCWGSPADKTDDTTSTCESSDEEDDDDMTGESSQPSLSRLNKVLKLKHQSSDVSEITTLPSEDESDSDSEYSGHEG